MQICRGLESVKLFVRVSDLSLVDPNDMNLRSWNLDTSIFFPEASLEFILED